MTEVRSVSIAGSAAAITSQTDTQITFNVRPGINCGVITLLSSDTGAVQEAALSWHRLHAACGWRGFAQVLSQASATVTSPGAAEGDLGAPLLGSRNEWRCRTQRATYRFTRQHVVGTLTMSGPVTLPVLSGDSNIAQ